LASREPHRRRSRRIESSRLRRQGSVRRHFEEALKALYPDEPIKASA